MIFDSLLRCDAYMPLGEGFRKAFAWLKASDLSSLPEGRYDIDGDYVYAMIQQNALKPWEQGMWEAHRRYADIQMVIRGREVIGFCDISALADAPYDAEKDLILYSDAPGQQATLQAGDMMILFPWDAHRPGIRAAGGEDTVRKVVVKVCLQP